MKKVFFLICLVFLICLSINVASAFGPVDFWKLQNNVLKPLKDTWTIGGNATLPVINSTTTNSDNLTVYSDLVVDYLTAGSIPFIGASKGLTQNNNDLYYDYTNNRVGIGTNSPDEKLEVVGTSTLNLIDASNYRIKNVADPIDDLDAVNKAYYDAGFTGGVSWQDEVLNILDFTTSEPAAPSVGDRYITNATGTMSVTGQYGYSQHIYTWDTADWATTTPLNKMGVKNIADGNLYVFNQTDWVWNSIGSSWAHSVLLDVKGSTEQYHVSFNQYLNMFVKGADDTDDLSEGATNLFYSDARVDTRVQGQSYTVTGDWVFNNPVTVDNPTSDLHAVNWITMLDYLQGFTWKVPVLDKDLSTPPVSPTLGDRYIVAGTAANWYDTDWSARQPLDLSSTDVSAAQIDYPVLIKLTDSGNTIFSTAQSDGDDILFTNEDGDKIKHEIESYNATNELLVWVKIPYLSSTSTTNIYVYYGNASCGSQQEVANTWDSDYEIVYHLDEASGSADDSTGVYDGSNTNVTYSATGKIGKGYDFNGTSAYTDTNCTTDLSGTGDFTIEAWMEADSSTEVYGITQTHTAPSYTSDFIFFYNGASNLWWMRSKQLAEPGGFTATNFNHVVMAWDQSAGTYEGFVNGVSAGTSASISGYGGINSIKLASRGDATSSFWDGVMDEMRISTSLRSDDYILTTYNITSDPASFISFGAEETLTASGDWAGHINDITEWDSVNWTFDAPSAGWAIIVVDEDLQYVYDGSKWIVSSGALGAHNVTTGIQGGKTNEYYHFEASEYTEVTNWLDDVVLSDGGAMNIGAGDFTTTGDISSDDVTATGVITGNQVVAAGSVSSHPSGIGAYLELYVLSGTTARILPFDGASYYDLAIGDWNSGDPNIMLKTGGAVGINEGSPATKLHVAGDGYFEGESDTEQLTVRGHTTQLDNTFVVEQSDGTDIFTVDNNGDTITSGSSTTTGNLVVASSTDSQGSMYVDSLTGHVGIGTTTPFHTLDIDQIDMRLNGGHHNSDVHIYFGNTPSGHDDFFLDNYDTTYFNDNGQTFVLTDDTYIDGGAIIAGDATTTGSFQIGDLSTGLRVETVAVTGQGNYKMLSGVGAGGAVDVFTVETGLFIHDSNDAAVNDPSIFFFSNDWLTYSLLQYSPTNDQFSVLANNGLFVLGKTTATNGFEADPSGKGDLDLIYFDMPPLIGNNDAGNEANLFWEAEDDGNNNYDAGRFGLEITQNTDSDTDTEFNFSVSDASTLTEVFNISPNGVSTTKDINLTGIVKTTNSVATEQQQLQSFWPFKYIDGLGVNDTGMYFNAIAGYIEHQYQGNVFFKTSITGLATYLGNTNDHRLLFSSGATNTGLIEWKEDEDYFNMDSTIFSGAVTTTGNFMVASSTDSTGSLYVDSLTGRVGIGTTTPRSSLSIDNGGSLIIGEADDRAGQALCFLVGGKIGYCSDAVDASGQCTCNAL